jgi:hypothetical protein
VKEFCILTMSSSFERCHVVDNKDFFEVYEEIFQKECPTKITTVQNLVLLREDIHRDYMDSLNKPINLRKRRLGFDFINKVCYSQDFDTGEIEMLPWKVAGIDVHNAFLAWSNSAEKSTKKIRRHLKKIDYRLVDFKEWI